MSFAGLLVHDVTIVRAGTTTDRYGNTMPNWATATSTAARGWITQIGDWKLFVPAGTSITGRDRVTWNGLTFEVVGPPRRAWSPRGEHHVECQLRIIEG